MRAAFWRFAHQHYHGKQLTLLEEMAAFTWTLFFVLVYGSALFAGWRPTISEAIVGVVLVAVPLTFGLLYRRIRLEAAKAPDALYRKRVETSR